MYVYMDIGSFKKDSRTLTVDNDLLIESTISVILAVIYSNLISNTRQLRVFAERVLDQLSISINFYRKIMFSGMA